MRTLTIDIETHSADFLHAMTPQEFVRLIGYKWSGSDQVVITDDVDEARRVIREADMIVGHNIHSFDLPALFGTGSDEPVQLADAGRVYDTWTHAVLVHPAPWQYTNRDGHKRFAASPSQLRSWFSLDEQAHQLGVPGKTHDLAKLAREFGDPALKPKARAGDGYGKIPVTDQRYRDYLAGDIAASEAVAKALLRLGPLDAYAMREQRIEARKARISNNGFRVDPAAAEALAGVVRARKEELVGRLARDYGFPSEGAKPWVTRAGKTAILAMLADHGITPDTRPDWTRTATGELSLGAETLTAVTAGTDVAELGTMLAELQGQRTLAQLALDSMHADGLAHPQITMLQRSGRWSTTAPGLTVWSERDDVKRQDKAVFVPDTGDHVLLELDYSAADARVVAALSGDGVYVEQFGDDRAALARLTGDPGYRDHFPKDAGAHAINAVLAFGAEAVAADPAGYRQKSKALGHAWNYGAGPHTLARNSGLPYADAKKFCDGLARNYRDLTRWQDRVRAEGKRNGCVVNPWGRRMRLDKGREYTQAPAFLGQSGTREIVCDAILRMPLSALRSVKAQVHDALVVSVPADRSDACRGYLTSLMETTLHPEGGQAVHFPVGCGPAGRNWAEAGH